MSRRRVRYLLDRIGGVTDACDLDLLLFFHRHPRAVLTSERLALYVGYELSHVAKSLDALITSGLLTRVQRPTASARMYVLRMDSPRGGWLDALLRLVATREGRLAALAALSQGRSSGDASRRGDAEAPATRAGRDPHVQARNEGELRHA